MDILDSLVDHLNICIIHDKYLVYENCIILNSYHYDLSPMYKFMEESMDILEIGYRVLNWWINYGLYSIQTKSIFEWNTFKNYNFP